jgi:hypothetical protein
MSAVAPASAPSASSRAGILLCAAVVLCAAAAAGWLRPGFVAGDDYSYLESAARFVNGDRAVPDFIVMRRYGFTLPIALPVHFWGAGSFGVLLVPLLFFAAETALVAFLAWSIAGVDAAIFAAALAGFLPLRLFAAGVATPDSEVAFFIALSFTLFYVGELYGGKRYYAAAGLAAGAVFWAKEKAIVFVLAYAVFPLLLRRCKREWAWFAAGAAVMIALAWLWFWVLSGDPLYLPRSFAANVQDRYRGATTIFATSPQYYFRLLFGSVRHYGIVPLLALAGLGCWWRRRRPAADTSWYPAAWAVALLCVFSFTVTSLAPFRFIAKQYNYSLYFIAPFAAFAGLALSSLPRRAAIALAILTSVLGLSLAALRRQANDVFLATSWAAVDFAWSHPDAAVFGSVVNVKVSGYARWTRPGFASQHIALLPARPEGSLPDEAYAIVDRQTLPVDFTVPSCWREVGRLSPSAGGPVAALLRSVRPALGRVFPAPALRSVDALTSPAPAVIYRIHHEPCT